MLLFMAFGLVIYQILLKQPLPTRPYILTTQKPLSVSKEVFFSWIGALSIMMFLFDLALPIAISTGLPYLLIIILSWYLNNNTTIVLYYNAITMATVFNFIQYLISFEGSESCKLVILNPYLVTR